MCGVLAIVEGVEVEGCPAYDASAAAAVPPPPAAADWAPALARRGPDGGGGAAVALGAGASLHLAGSLLQLRGSAPSAAPLADARTGSLLLFNGEVFGGLPLAPGASDAAALLTALAACAADAAAVVGVLSRLRGPWALIYWSPEARTLFFGRDALGRRSLLRRGPTAADTRLVLASCAPAGPAAAAAGFEEVPPGVHGLRIGPAGSPAPCRGALESHAWRDAALLALASFERPAAPPPSAGAAAVVAALRAAVAVRVRALDAPPAAAAAAAAAPPPPDGLPPARVLVLFSGGVDSTLIAILAHAALPPGEAIDLASVCFAGGASPDRAAARDALAELRAAAPSRAWRLIAVDGSLAAVDAARPALLRLLAPAATVMDLNIGAALWLAAGADGYILDAAGGDSAAQRPRYRSAARVALLGHGADELFAGYARHRTRFAAGGAPALAAELRRDAARLWLRNLGRDDRLVADRGREARHPFLDEAVVAAALAAPLGELADLALPPGVGDKRALRAALAAAGLPRAAARVKRAIQFGTRLAALTNAAHLGGTRQASRARAGAALLADVGLADAS
jgi:asparagine synthetase B (glutamine-hydrolysing)